LTLQKVIKFSSNIGASQIGFRVGAKKLYQYIRKFGFGTRTSIDLPGEVKGLVRDPKTLSEIGIANSSFGQGISVTAIQLAMALSAIANGGDLMRPYVVERIIDSYGRVLKSFNPKKIKRVISRDTSREVVRIMKQVVEPDGTGARAALSGYVVAGKTGTAQKIDHHLKTYTKDRYVSSFMGFVPADGPRLVIVVILDEPKGTPYGGIVAAPVFRTIAERALSRLNIPPSRGVVAQNEKSRAQSEPPVQKETASKGPVAPQAGEARPHGSGVSMRALLEWLRIRLGW
jgi:cell division protein FtsI (penicillin-binding protein 3)